MFTRGNLTRSPKSISQIFFKHSSANTKSVKKGTTASRRKFDVKSSVNSTETVHENAYFEEFMKLIKAQKELPFIYSSKNLQPEQIHVPFLKNMNLKNVDESSMQSISFEDLGVKLTLCKRLAEQNVHTPLPVQKRSLPFLLQGRKAIIGSVTGSGKTLTYLIPILQNMGNNPCENIVIVPTRELASQVYKEFLKFVPDRHLVSRHVSGINEEQEKKLSHVLKNSRILIGTPKKLLEIVEDNMGHFKQVRRVVLDEVDKLLPYNRGKLKNVSLNKIKPTEKLLSIFSFYRRSTQFIATSATISSQLVRFLQDSGFSKESEVIRLIPEDSKYGKIPEAIKHNFLELGQVERHDKLRHVGRLFDKSKEMSTLVFIHRSESVEQVVDEFKDMGYTAAALYKELLLPAPGSFDNFLNSFESGDTQIVVSTEETVRGMDFPFINRIYLTYVPDSPEHYVHVAGRVGRLYKLGVVTTMVQSTEEVDEKKRLRRLFKLLGVKARVLKL